jgi:hypothetical protein
MNLWLDLPLKTVDVPCHLHGLPGYRRESIEHRYVYFTGRGVPVAEM